MSEQITNEQYTQSMYILQNYIQQLNRVIELEGLQNILVKIIQDINRQIVKVKDYERVQAECQKEIDRLKLLRRE